LVPGLGKLLETTPHETIRNNIVCILCDWVVRYATAIDPVIPQVSFVKVKVEAVMCTSLCVSGNGLFARSESSGKEANTRATHPSSSGRLLENPWNVFLPYSSVNM